MKCIQCGSEWSVSDKLKSSIIKCPFCHADLYINKPQEIVDVLIEWGNKEGIDFFKNSMKINGLLADLFPNKGKERNAIKIALEKGIGSQIVQLYYEEDERIKLIRINQMKQVLLEDAWLSESAADFVMNTLITASDMVDNHTIKNEELKESENSIQDQIVELMEKARKYEEAEKFDDAVSFYKDASILGDIEAAYRIAQIFSQDELRLSESIEWYIIAAERGHNKAQNNLGYMYEHGEGVNKDLKKALYWYEKSAMSGNRNAQHNLAFFYYKGAGTLVNYKKAFYWYSKAAKQGHPGAQNNLGIMYEYGYGVEKNIEEAIKWYGVASENGNEDGKFNFERCIKRVSAKG